MPTDSTLRARRLSELQFKTMAEAWHRCVSASDAHPLFMSWPWLYSWWETWSQVLGLELLLIGVFDEEDQLVGIGPFYRRDLVTPLGFRVNRLHLIGNAWHVAPTVRTEYCGLIVRGDRANAICRTLMEAVERHTWDEWVICDVVDSELNRIESNLRQNSPNVIRVSRGRDEGVRIDTGGAFNEWLSNLGRNTRLKLYNRRDYLNSRGEFVLEHVDKREFEQFLGNLNQFHLLRWGKPAFDAEAVRFHTLLCRRLPFSDARVVCSSLKFNGKCISVLYDVIIGSQRFNLQSGYFEDFDRRVSLGPLHLGFAIQEGFQDPDIHHYDLLAGGGKRSYYKHHFRGNRVDFQTVQLVSHPLLSAIYRGQGVMPEGWRAFINRWFKL